jgi:hypothetical protein
MNATIQVAHNGNVKTYTEAEYRNECRSVFGYETIDSLVNLWNVGTMQSRVPTVLRVNSRPSVR